MRSNIGLVLVWAVTGCLLSGTSFAQSPAAGVRTLVWANPGTDGSALEAANWTEYASAADYAAGQGGKPAAAKPDAGTDIVLPDAPAGGKYAAGFLNLRGRNRNPWTEPPALACRNVTIGRGAALDGGLGSSRGAMAYTSRSDDDCAVEIHGDVTVAAGGILCGKLIFAGGKASTFNVTDSPEPLGISLTVRKPAGAAVTVNAPQYDLVAGVTVESGTLVLGRATQLRFGATDQARKDLGKIATGKRGEGFADQHDAYVYVRKGATLEMQPGSSLARVKTPDNPAADLRVEGTLLISAAGAPSGTPGTGEVAPATIALTAAKGEGRFLTQAGGLYIRPTAEVKNGGRLVITAADPSGPAKADTGISIFLEKPVDLGDVSFDYLRAGGIVSRDPAAAKAALAKAIFGSNCAAKGDALFARLDLVDFAGGMGTVEFVDGLKTECEILYPNAGRLVVRAKGNRTVQSFDLRSVRRVTIAGKTTEFNPARPLTNDEQQLREFNALWADVAGEGQIGKFATHEWPRLPLLVWRNPGESGSRFVGANWLDEKGVPCFDSPLDIDPDVDVLMPGSDTHYVAEGFGTGGIGGSAVACRHLTIERNAGYGATYNVRGSLWMKHGSGLRGRNRGQFVNPAEGVHRFIRLDGMLIDRNQKSQSPFKDRRDGGMGQWATYVMGRNSTIEFTARARVAADTVNFSGEGTFIMSEGSFLCGGERAAITIHPGTTLIMLQDAVIGHEITVQRDECFASLFVGGTLSIGTPDRPIRKDMPFPLAGVLREKINLSAAANARATGASLIVAEGGRLAFHSADPAKARVVFSMWNTDRAKGEGRKWGTPEGIILGFAGKTELGGVVFDNVYEGGIVVSPAQRAAWKNVSYGEHNLAAPEKLYTDSKK